MLERELSLLERLAQGERDAQMRGELIELHESPLKLALAAPFFRCCCLLFLPCLATLVWHERMLFSLAACTGHEIPQGTVNEIRRATRRAEKAKKHAKRNAAEAAAVAAAAEAAAEEFQIADGAQFNTDDDDEDGDDDYSDE